MSVPTWPADLPFVCSLRDLSYSGPLGDRIAFQPDVGAPSVRRRTTAAYRRLSGAIAVLTLDQFAVFEAFWDTDLNGGVADFYAIHPVTGATARFRPTGETYTPTALGGGKMRVSLDLWQVPTGPGELDFTW